VIIVYDDIDTTPG